MTVAVIGAGSSADALGLRELIRFGVTVERLDPHPDGGWWISLDDGSVRRFQAVVVAIGLFWSPTLPDDAAGFAGEVSHSSDYRTPAPFTGRRVLVVGAGQSAAEIAVEVAGVAARTCISMRSGAHVVPRWIGGQPYDAADVDPLNRMPWKLLNLAYGRRVARELGPLPARWPVPDRRLLEGVPIVSSDLLPAVRRGQVTVKPAIQRLAADRVRFTDGTEEPVDRIVDATGYRIDLPFLAPSLLAPRGRELPLYRRIVPPGLGGLLLAGFVDAPGGLLPVVETQAEWIAAVLTGRLRLPTSEGMWRAIDRGERRSRERFPGETPRRIRCDPHAYRRLPQSDLRRARRAPGSTPHRWRRAEEPASGGRR
jgi:dimethylaniline monooxygenase (N-oxide forming)